MKIKIKVNMIECVLWKTAEIPDTREIASNHGHRQVLKLTIDRQCLDVSWQCQGRSKCSGEWNDLHADSTGVSLCFTRFKWGTYHVYYDGPHCGFNVGPFIIHWNNWNCRECLAETGEIV